MAKKGFKVITVHEAIYNQIVELAKDNGVSMAKIIEDLVAHYEKKEKLRENVLSLE